MYLVVIWEGNDGGTDAQDHGGVDLTVCVGGAVLHVLVVELVGRHGQHGGLLLQGVDILHHAAGHQVLPTEHTQNMLTVMFSSLCHYRCVP